jgi:hypothetical protein
MEEGFMSKHTVTITLPNEEYAQLKELADEQDRYISAQARHMLRDCLRQIAEIEQSYNLNTGAPEARDYLVNSGTAMTEGPQPPEPKQEPLPG